MNQAASREKLAYFSLGLLTSMLYAWRCIATPNIRDIPLTYSWDGLFNAWLFKRILEPGSWLNSLHHGHPFSSPFLDFPFADQGSFSIASTLGKFLDITPLDWPLLINTFYGVGFPICFTISFIVFSRLTRSPSLSILGALLYTFLPYHLERAYHILLTFYFVIPLFIYYSFKISQSKLFMPKDNWHTKILDALAIFASGYFGVYYSVFGLVVFLIAGTDSWLRSSKAAVRATLWACSLIIGALFLQIVPNLIYWVQHGRNPDALLRSAGQTEFYGLKIIQLILPHTNHRSLVLDRINQAYSEQFGWFVNENSHAALGLLGSIGFLTLIFLVLFRLDLPRRTEQIRFFGMITLGMILIGTVGGFSSGISLISPMIRSWNRVSVVIAFCAIATFLTLMEMLTDYLKRRGVRPSMIRLLLISILIFGLWEQSPRPCPQCQQAIAAEFQGDRDYFRQVEATLPKGAAIYQLPYFSFPEGEIAYRVKSYDFFRGYLHTKDLKWNLGGTRGREGDRFYAQLSKQSIPEQIAAIRKLGFSAILVDRYGYAEGDRSTEQALLDSGQVEPERLVSANGRFALYRLKPQPAEAPAP